MKNSPDRSSALLAGSLPRIGTVCTLLGAAPDVAAEAIRYLRPSLAGMSLGLVLFLANSALQASGNTVVPMAAMLAANLLNLLLAPIFIFGWGPMPVFGVAGAAWATLLAQAIAGLGLILLMPCFVLANAAATLVGQNLGAGQPQRARRAAWCSTGLVLAIVAASVGLLFAFTGKAVALFDQTPEVVAIGSGFLRVVSPFYLLAGVSIVLDRALNGAGCTVSTMLFTLALHVVMSVAWFSMGRWMHKRV